jgi:CheY-like chemotaxis protein
MDHSYRQNTGSAGGGGGYGGGGQRFRGSYQQQRFHPPQQDVEPVPAHISADAPTRIVCVIDDLFFLAKVQETARKLNVKVDFVKSDKELLERATSNGHDQPSLIIVDLNNTGAKPLTTIPKLKSKLKGTSIIGFLSHVQGELKVKAQEAGFDAVMPRSALSQNLAQILRRHGAPEESETEQ